MQDFELDLRLRADSLEVADLPLSAVRLMRDANYPWLLVVPRRPGLVEMVDLDAADRAQLMAEIAQASAALREVVQAAKLNVASLGNKVRQLHVHVIARSPDDPAWPKPVWGAVPPKVYQTGEAEALAARLAEHLR